MTVVLLTVVILLALLFTLTNGLNDASAVVATFISCGVATPSQAVVLAAVFEIMGALFSGNAVASTIAGIGTLPADSTVLAVLIAALLGAVSWNMVAWRYGLPSSSTHALIGGLIGSIWISYGSSSVVWGWSELFGPSRQLTGFIKIVVYLFLSPLLGLTAGFCLQKAAMFVLRNSHFSAVNRRIKRLQWFLVAILAFGHGGNDTQKTVGLIVAALVACQMLPGSAPPVWVRFGVGFFMFCGVLFGGWTIMRTIGRGIYTVRPLNSFCSQVASGGSVALANLLGAPVATTHIVVGSIAGVGSAEEYRMVNWQIGRQILIAWIITIPASALSAAVVFVIIKTLLGGYGI